MSDARGSDRNGGKEVALSHGWIRDMKGAGGVCTDHDGGERMPFSTPALY
jgi:hypothetical protein